MKIKYQFEVHDMLASYPTEEDALYDILKFLSESQKQNDEFSIPQIKKAFSKKIEDSEIQALLNSLVLQNFMSSRKVNDKKEVYKIILNPFLTS